MKWPWSETRRLERQLAEAELRADLGLARFRETVSADVAAALMAEDQGWRNIGALGGDGYELSAATLSDARRKCLDLWRVDPTIARAAKLLKSATFGNGGIRPSCVDVRCQDVADALWDDAGNSRVLFGREAMELTNLLLMLEGERFLTLSTSLADASVRLADIPAGQIVEIVPYPNNARRPLLYKREWYRRTWNAVRGEWKTGTKKESEFFRDWSCFDLEALEEDGEDEALSLIRGCAGLVEDSVVYQVRVNTVGLRGVPEVWRALDWARAHASALSDMATYVKAQSMFAWKKKVKTKVQSYIEDAARQLASPAPGTGSFQIENQNVDLQPISTGTGQQANQQATARQLFLEVIRSVGVGGEHYYGDASTGNLATASAMELPAIWDIGDRQELFTELFVNVTLFAITWCRDHPFDNWAKLPQRVDTTVDVDFPPPQPRTPEATAVILGALGAASGLLIDEQEASFQAYLALGCDDIEEIMERQYPPEEKLEDQDPIIALEPGELPPDDVMAPPPPPGPPPPPPAPVAPMAEARSARRSFAAEVQVRVISPWHNRIRAWLSSLGETPAQATLKGHLKSSVAPDGARLRTILEEHSLRAANAAGQTAVDKIHRGLRHQRKGEAGQTLAQRLSKGRGWNAPEGGFVFNLRDPKLRAELRRRGEKITGEVTQTMLLDLHRVLIEQFYREGLGPAEVAKGIEAIFPETYANRAETIARTETLVAQSTVQRATYRNNGIGRRQWIATMDNVTRDSHAEANGQVVAMDEPFNVGGVELDGPGDPNGPPEEIINCRCDELPVIDDDTDLPEQPWLGGEE
ncbi:MAG TPA: phage minor head protein [Phycisphaerae bacterium]|nr:phage minor head protein [Phycisphaerae bacterium]